MGFPKKVCWKSVADLGASLSRAARGSRQRCEGAKVEFALMARRIAACLVAGTRTDSLGIEYRCWALMKMVFPNCKKKRPNFTG